MLTKANNHWGDYKEGFKIQASEKLITLSINEGWINSLALYFLLKHRFKNSCLFDLQRRKSEISRLAKVSPKTLQRNLEVLHAKGLTYWHNGNLILKSIHKITKEYKERNACTLCIPGNTSLKNIEYLLFSKDLHQRARKQKHKANCHDQRYTGDSGESGVWPLFAYRSLANSWQCSQFKVKTIFDWLTASNLIKKQTVSKNYGKVSVKEIDGKLYPGPGWPYLNRKNELVVVYGTTLTFKDFPIN